MKPAQIMTSSRKTVSRPESWRNIMNFIIPACLVAGRGGPGCCFSSAGSRFGDVGLKRVQAQSFAVAFRKRWKKLRNLVRS